MSILKIVSENNKHKYLVPPQPLDELEKSFHVVRGGGGEGGWKG